MREKKERHPEDWYVDPAWATKALLAVERPFIGIILDPCCGKGTIPETLINYGILAWGSDLVDRGYMDLNAVCDYKEAINANALGLYPDSVISNPPFKLAQDFIDHFIPVVSDRLCVLLRLPFLESQKRAEWFKSVPLARVWVFSERLSMLPGNVQEKAEGGKVAYAWFVFEKDYRGLPTLGHLPTQKELAAQAAHSEWEITL